MNAVTKTITVEDFRAMLERDWARDQHIEQVDCNIVNIDEEEVQRYWGFASITSTLAGVSIEYQEGWSYNECDAESFSADPDGLDRVWTIDGVVVVDEDGEPLSQWEIGMMMPSAFSGIDYSGLDIDQVQDIDIDEEDDMDTITLENDNAPDIRFAGELVVRTSSSAETASSYYSGSTGRYTILELYKTAGGKFICHSIGVTQWQGEHDRHKVAVCDTEAEVIAFFGHGWLAKDLYEAAGIADIQEVE